MRKLLLLAALAASQCFGATFTNVQGCNGSGSLSASCTLGANVTGGNLLVVITRDGDAIPGGATPTLSSTGVTCSWTLAVPVLWTNAPMSGDFDTTMYYCLPASSGSMTVEVTWSESSLNFVDLAVAEYSTTNGWKIPTLDQEAAQANASSTNCTSGTTPATSSANDLLVGACVTWDAAETWGPVSGWTNSSTSSRNTLGWYDSSTTTTGAQTWSMTMGTATANTGLVAAFQPRDTPPPVPMMPGVY
jgi:hypothetical protein